MGKNAYFDIATGIEILFQVISQTAKHLCPFKEIRNVLDANLNYLLLKRKTNVTF